MNLVILNKELIKHTVEMLITIHHPLFDKDIDWPPLSNKYEKSLNELLSLQNHTFLLLEENNKFIGYVLYLITYEIGIGKYKMIILNLYLLEEFRGQGYGSILLNKCIAYAKEIGCKTIFLETHINNEANDFYKNKGFIIKNNQTNFYELNL